MKVSSFLAVPLALLAAACGSGGGTGASVGHTGGFFGPASTAHLYFSQDSNGNGLFEIDMNTGAATLIGTGLSGVTAATVGLTETTDPDVLLGSIWVDVAQIQVDGSGATVLPGSVAAEALAMNTATGLLYGGINGQFFQIDPVTGLNIGALAAPGADVEGLAADPTTNRIFGIIRGAPNLLVYDVATNAWSIVGSTGVSWRDPGLAYDDRAGVLFAVDSITDQLYRIDPNTAAATAVGPLGTNGAGGLALVYR